MTASTALATGTVAWTVDAPGADDIRVTITPSVRLVHAAAPAPATVVLDRETLATGGTVTLNATDDPDVSPTGWTWVAHLRVDGELVTSFPFHLASGSSINLATEAPVDTSTGTPILRGPKGDPGDGGSGGGGGGAVDSVNGRTGIVVLDADDIADTTTRKLLTSAERTKLSGIATAATANATDAALRDRATHTGTQTAATISDLREQVEDYVAALLAAGSNVTLTYTDNGSGAGSLSIAAAGGGGGTTDPEAVRDAIGVALAGAGLISVAVNDVADTITISTTATANATDAQLRDRTTHTGAQAISTVTGLQTALDAKAATASPTFTGTVSGVTKAHVGLGNVDNTADTAKPVSTAQQTAIDAAKARANHTGTQAASTITGLATVATSGAYGDLSGTPTIPAAYTDEQARDVIATALVAGSNVTITPNDGADTITIAASGGGGGGADTAARTAAARTPLPTTSVPGVFAESLPRWTPSVAGSALSTGIPRLVALRLNAGEVVSSLTFMTGATGGSGMTRQWAALADSSGTILAVSADLGSAAWPGSTLKTFTMGSPYTVPADGVYYAAVDVVGTTPPQLVSLSMSTALQTATLPYVSGVTPSNTGAPPTVGASLGTITHTATINYVAVA